MSVVTLSYVKAYLGVIGSDNDTVIQLLLDAAEDEAKQFMDIESFDEILEINSESPSEGVVPASIRHAIIVLVQAGYNASPSDAIQLRKVAQIKLQPFRKNLGV